jgi:hypothetical protein
VAFSYTASDLADGDSRPSGSRVVLRDRTLGTTELVSVSALGLEVDDESSGPDISGSGRFVAFQSQATNLIGDDTNGVRDVFVRDRQEGTTVRLSVSSLGVQANAWSIAHAISGDGRFVGFLSEATNLVIDDTNGVDDVFAHHLESSTTLRVSLESGGGQANGESRVSLALSSSGQYVAFASAATNLVPDDTDATPDVFLRRLW